MPSSLQRNSPADPGNQHLFISPELYGPDCAGHMLEQYRLYVESADRVSDRRASTNTYLLTVNTSLVTVYGLVLGSGSLMASGMPWSYFVPLAGIAASIMWYALIDSHRRLNFAKFKVIHLLEARLPARPFEAEWEILKRGETSIHRPITRTERYVPVVFGLFYVVLLINSVVNQ